MKHYIPLRGTLFDIERELRTRNSGADEAISEAFVWGVERTPTTHESLDKPTADTSSSAAPAARTALAAMGATEATGKEYLPINLNTWMNLIPDDTPLSSIVMPGSHDALVSKTHYQPKRKLIGRSTEANTVCQDRDILGQLEMGSRFFDIRLEKTSDGKVLGIHAEWFAYKIGDGGYGQSWEEAVSQAVCFLNQFEDQFIIFKVTHVKNETDFVKIYNKVLEGKIPNEGDRSKRILEATVSQNIALLTYNDLKGRLIVVTDAKEGLEPQQKGVHKFVKGKYEIKEVTSDGGLKVYDAFAGKWSMFDIISKAREAMDKYAEIENPKDGLMQIYWQRTDYTAGVPFIQGNLEEGAKELRTQLHNIKHFHNTRDHSGGIVSYDFVNEKSSQMIINLNTRIFKQKS